MNPNYLSPGMPQYLPPMAYMPQQGQQYGCSNPYYQQMQPKRQNNAVNIEILRPMANGQAMPMYPGMAQLMQPQMPPMMMPPMPPPMQPQMPPVMMPPMSPPMQPQMPPVMMPPMPPQMQQQMPSMPGQFPQQEQFPPMGQPMPPPPTIDQAQPQANQPGQVPPGADQAQPQINQPGQAPPATDQAQPPMGQPQEQVNPQSNQQIAPLVNAINVITPKQGENQPTIDDQAAALKAINDHINQIKTMDPAAQKAINEQLLPNDGSTFKGLAAIAASDTSAFPEQEKQKANEVRVMSLFTLANLQKYFRQEFNNQLKKENIQGVPSVPLGELPGVKIIEQIIKADPNPEMREAGIYALMGVTEPTNQQDIQILKTILQDSLKKEKDKNVREKLEEAVGAIDKVKQQA